MRTPTCIYADSKYSIKRHGGVIKCNAAKVYLAAYFEKRKPLVRPGVQLSFSVESLMLKSILSINIKLRPVNCSFN